MQTIEATRLLTADEAALRLGVSRHRVYELARRGALPLVRLGRTVRIDPRALDRFIESGGTRDGSGR